MNLFYILYFVLGVLAGGLITKIMATRKPSGTLRIDQSDPGEPPYMFLEGVIPMHMLIKKKTITFKVSVKDFIPHI